MNANERDEIAASVAAHAELGSRYEDAVAEGLVERIGEEIDKRIDARMGGQRPPQPAAVTSQGPAGYPGPAWPQAAPAAVPAPPAPRRSGGASGMVLGLGSMGLGLASLAVVVSNHVAPVAAVFITLLVWAAIAVVNVAHARRKI